MTSQRNHTDSALPNVTSAHIVHMQCHSEYLHRSIILLLYNLTVGSTQDACIQTNLSMHGGEVSN